MENTFQKLKEAKACINQGITDAYVIHFLAFLAAHRADDCITRGIALTVEDRMHSAQSVIALFPSIVSDLGECSKQLKVASTILQIPQLRDGSVAKEALKPAKTLDHIRQAFATLPKGATTRKEFNSLKETAYACSSIRFSYEVLGLIYQSLNHISVRNRLEETKRILGEAENLETSPMNDHLKEAAVILHKNRFSAFEEETKKLDLINAVLPLIQQYTPAEAVTA